MITVITANLSPPAVQDQTEEARHRAATAAQAARDAASSSPGQEPRLIA